MLLMHGLVRSVFYSNQVVRVGEYWTTDLVIGKIYRIERKSTKVNFGVAGSVAIYTVIPAAGD